MQIRDRKRTDQKSPQKSDLGTSWAPFGGFGGGFGKGLEALGAFWVVLEAPEGAGANFEFVFYYVFYHWSVQSF